MNKEIIKAKAKQALDAGVIIGDGHTLFFAEYYAPHFTLDELNEAGLVQVHESDGSHKGSIYGSDGNIIQELKGVYNLYFLYWLASQLGVTERIQSMGRGSQASELVGHIRKVLA